MVSLMAVVISKSGLELRNERSTALLGVFGLSLLVVLALPNPVLAGSICGTVGDELTAEPVANAGIFIRAVDGTYTGLHGATDQTGWFCIDNVPEGIYDLEILVNDYQVGYLRGIEVTDTQTSVEATVALPALNLAPPWPNPASEYVHMRVVARGDVPFQLLVFDVRGRFVRGWTSSASTPRELEFVWDGRDRSGQPVPSGCYFIRIQSGTVEMTRRALLIR